MSDPVAARAERRARQREAREGKPKPGRCHECGGTSAPGRSRCGPCTELRAEREREARAEESHERLPDTVARAILGGLVMGYRLTELCEEYQVAYQRVYTHRVYDPEWGEALDEALMRGRDPGLEHGRAATYRLGSCRCPECRAAKRDAGWWG